MDKAKIIKDSLKVAITGYLRRDKLDNFLNKKTKKSTYTYECYFGGILCEFIKDRLDPKLYTRGIDHFITERLDAANQNKILVVESKEILGEFYLTKHIIILFGIDRKLKFSDVKTCFIGNNDNIQINHNLEWEELV